MAEAEQHRRWNVTNHMYHVQPSFTDMCCLTQSYSEHVEATTFWGWTEATLKTQHESDKR